MIYIYLLSVIFICSVLYLTFDVLLSATERIQKIPFVYFCILSVVMFLIAFAVKAHQKESMAVYNLHILYLSLLPLLPLCLLLFSINLQEESLTASKYIKYIFSATSVLLSLTVFMTAPRSVPANFNAFTFIFDILVSKTTVDIWKKLQRNTYKSIETI